MNQANLGEQAVSKAAEVGIESQLDEVDELDIDIKTNPLDLAGGKLESVTIDGSGMVMQKDLRTERLILETDSIAIDSLKAAFGDIELIQDTNAEVKIVLLAEDMQRAFNSEYIKHKLENQQVNIDGKTVTVNASNVTVELPGDDKISISADLTFVESQQTEHIAFLAKPTLDANHHQIMIKDVEYPNGEDTSLELTKALLDSTTELLDLRNFELGEMSLQISQLEVCQGKIIIAASALIQEFPDS